MRKRIGLAAVAMLVSVVLTGFAQEQKSTPEAEKTEKELILAVGIKMGDLNRVYLSIREDLDKQSEGSRGHKNWGLFSKELRAEMAKVATEVNEPSFKAKVSLEAFARLERELQIWQTVEEERRGKGVRPNPPASALGGLLPSGPTINLVQYDPIQIAAWELLQDPKKLKALQDTWSKALNLPPAKPGEGLGKQLQRR